ncbi:O-antigen polymerase [Allofournierella sp. CML151]|uniref:O-antigen polymerase n=1 Tax=Allofournierella sp. CML151 TaxID=2998082 RepID=UPI0022EA52AE|nr:O-antigen polymerase [Fournierella sp. CML151]
MAVLFLSIALFGWICLTLRMVKHISAPPIIIGLVFLVSYILIVFAYGESESNEWFYSCYFFAVIFFSVGFFIPLIGKKLANTPMQSDVYFSTSFFWIIWMAEFSFSMVQLWKMLISARGSAYNIWSAIKLNYQAGAFASFFFLFETVFFFVNVGIFFVNRSKRNGFRAIMSAIPLVPHVLSSHRGVWFMLAITLVFMFLFAYRPDNIRVIKIGLAAFIGLAIVIVISSFWKYGKWYDNPKELMQYVLNSYFSSPFVAFKQYMQSGPELKMGGNTFRFFIAVLHQLGWGTQPVDIVQPFVSVYGYPTNVYTGLYYYAADFGMWWAYVIELCLGFFYGILYVKTFNGKKINLLCLVGLSMLMYPLVNQFFDDKYFSILAEWLKYFIVLILLTQKCFVKSQGEKDEKRI